MPPGGHGRGRHRLAIAAFLAGMAQVGSAWASIASSFEPVFTVALGVAVLGDRLGPGKVAGGVAVVAGARCSCPCSAGPERA
jgi:drug/metabolite transporter (DMT)-like permease